MDQRSSIEQRAQRRLMSTTLGMVYTPDGPILDPSLLSGRDWLLSRCERLLGSRGATLVLYGERGVGKTFHFGRCC